eukprot:2168303-Rhodomonas_salina.2
MECCADEGSECTGCTGWGEDKSETGTEGKRGLRAIMILHSQADTLTGTLCGTHSTNAERFSEQRRRRTTSS